MPITVEHQPPLNWVGKVAFESGVNEGVARRRKELADRQMQLAQMQQSRNAQMQQIAAQQQAQQYSAQQNNQRMLFEAMQNQQQQQAAQDAKLAAYQQQQADRQAMAQQQNQWDMQKATAGHSMDLMDLASKNRADLEGFIAGVDPERLEPTRAKPLYLGIQEELKKLDASISGMKPEDYAYAVNELAGRAGALKLPSMQAPPPDPDFGMKTASNGVIVNPQTGEPTGKHRFVVDALGEKHEIGQQFEDPATGNVVRGKINGDVDVVWNAAEEKAKMMTAIDVQIDKEVTRHENEMSKYKDQIINPNQDQPYEDGRVDPVTGGIAIDIRPMLPNPVPPPVLFGGRTREEIFAERLSSRWDDLKKTAYRGVPQQQPQGQSPGEAGPPIPAPDSGMPGPGAAAPAGPPAPQPAPAAPPQPEPQITPRTPGPQPVAAPSPISDVPSVQRTANISVPQFSPEEVAKARDDVAAVRARYGSTDVFATRAIDTLEKLIAKYPTDFLLINGRRSTHRIPDGRGIIEWLHWITCEVTPSKG